MHPMEYREFKEAELKAVGGLSPDDRDNPGLDEMMSLAVEAVPKFREALNAGCGIKAWYAAAKSACRHLQEANSETALGFLLRKGLQVIANDWYNAAPVAWNQYCAVDGSNGFAEWYAPLYQSTIPAQVGRGQAFPEVAIVGENSVLVNQKFGQVVSVERELFDDDQSGQIKGRAKPLGEAMRITEGVYAAYRFIGSARTYANLTVPASGYATTDINGNAITAPFSTTIYGSSGNRPTTFAPLAIGKFKAAYTALLNAVDPQQNKIIVNPSVLLVSSNDALTGKMLLAEGYYPGVVGQSETAVASAPVIGGTVSAAGANQGVLAGMLGGIMSSNPFAGMGIKLVVERYLPAWAWGLMEGGKGLMFQQRDPMEITQEAPNTGSWFSFDVVKWRSRERFECDWIGGGSRFAYLGNDGSVTGTL